MSAQRIDEVISLLERYVLGEIELPRERVMAAIKLLDLMVPDARPSDDGVEALMSAFAFPRKFSA
jgi:hypothetical protein